ncbi:MAG: triose-phosphate isomerase [Vicingaceae bacterium]
MRKKIVAGNWKMNLNLTEANELLTSIKDYAFASKDKELVVIPPYIYLTEAINILKSNPQISVGAQNCSQFENGAYTGEISAEMLADLGCKYVIIGHSERRQYFKENGKTLKLKVNEAIKHNLTPIYCCGETLEERKSNQHFKVLGSQISKALFHLSKQDIRKIVMAYEPVWAIGTGVTASAQEAQETHNFIRNLIATKYTETIAKETTILYGGSCKPENAKDLFAQKDIDGGLIGGASLKSDSFLAIANAL